MFKFHRGILCFFKRIFLFCLVFLLSIGYPTTAHHPRHPKHARSHDQETHTLQKLNKGAESNGKWADGWVYGFLGRNSTGIKHVGNINILILLKICAEKSLFCIRKCGAGTSPSDTHRHCCTLTHTLTRHKLNKMASTKGCGTLLLLLWNYVTEMLAVVCLVFPVLRCNDKRC